MANKQSSTTIRLSTYLFAQRIASLLDKYTRKFLILLIINGRPLLGPPCRCRYQFSCTHFAVYQLEHEPRFFYALWIIIKRLASCHPFHRRKQTR